MQAEQKQPVWAGKSIQVYSHPDSILELRFDLQEESANKFNGATLTELKTAWDFVLKTSGTQGAMLTTGKDNFMMGADIPEFVGHFAKADTDLEEWLWNVQMLFCSIEDAPFPTVTLINGFALGGGCEVSLATDYRLLTTKAKYGLPEVKLGIYPGWGGTVRLPRLVGVDNAIEWIASGKHYSPQDALKVGIVDGVVAPENLFQAGLKVIKQANEGKLDWKARKAKKKSPIGLSSIESTMSFQTAKAFVGAQAGPHYPAPIAAIDSIEKGAKLTREEALRIETKGFVKVAKTPQADALVGVFLADQFAKKTGKKLAAKANPVKSAAVLGAGIMGGGIAYQSASSKIPVVMRDIRTEALDLGMKEASKILEKRVEKGQTTLSEMSETLARIRPTLSMSEVSTVDMVVEAVVEKESIKSAVLSELEGLVRPGTIIASNTSTISISKLARTLKNPQHFVGMHFFNPVHRMPLVEIIRGEKSSEEAVATAVSYSLAMGKTPIVVNDCPGFLVNRILFPYFGGFTALLRDGVDFEKIDKVMEKYGWPMGPAYLLDVVGIDTAHHAQEVMSAGFPDRMKYEYTSAIDLQYKAGRFGQKNGKGFYTYSQDPKGRPVKAIDPSVKELLAPGITGSVSVTDEEIVERMMLPMVFEAARCLEENIVATSMELDLSVLYGLGYPPFRGGVCKYADGLGAKKMVELAAKYSPLLGKLYEAPALIRKNAEKGTGFYPHAQC